MVRKHAAWRCQMAAFAASVAAGNAGTIFRRIQGSKKERIPADVLWVPDGIDEEGHQVF